VKSSKRVFPDKGREGGTRRTETHALVRKNGSPVDIQLVLDRNVVSENGDVLNPGLKDRKDHETTRSQRAES